MMMKLRSLLARRAGSAQAVSTAEAQQTVESYREAVDAVNRRLNDAVTLARKGLHSEAIHLADKAPSALEEASALDLAEWAELSALCDELGIETPAEVNGAAVAEINDCYPREERLSRLLVSHRRLALARAPIKARIGILRELSAADPDNSVWATDLATFEKARHRQIETTISTANRARLLSLKTEGEEVWLEPPSDEVKKRLFQRLAEMEDANAIATLKTLDEQLAAAIQSQDSNVARTVLARWDGVRKKLATKIYPSLTADEARRWIGELDARAAEDRAFAKALGTLETALDAPLRSQSGIDELDKCWSAVERFEREVPAVIHQRYHVKRDGLKLDTRRRFGMGLAAVVGAVLLVAGIVGTVIWQSSRSHELERWTQSLQQSIDASQWAEADKALERLASEKNWVRQTPEVEALAHTIKTKLAEEKTRVEHFRDAMKRVVDGGVEKPDRAALAEAKSLAATPDELTQYESWYSQIHGRDTKMQSQRDQEFERSLDGFRKQLGRANDDPNLPAETKINQVTQIQSGLQELLRRDDISPAILTAGKTLQTATSVKLESLRQARAATATRQLALSELTALFGDPEALAAKLSGFVEKYPDHELSVDFTKAKRLLPGWKLMPMWAAGLSSALGKGSDPGDVASLSFDEREKLASTLAAALKEDEKGLFAPQLEQVCEYVVRSVNAVDLKNSQRASQSDLRKLLTYRPIAELGILLIRNREKPQDEPRRLYVAANYKVPRALNKIHEIEYVANVYQALDRQPQSKCDVAEVDLDAKQLKDKCAPDSPQRLYSQEIIAALESPEFPRRWATFNLDALGRLVKAEQIDPLLRVVLAKSLVNMAKKQDWQDRPELDRWQKVLDQVDTKTNWLDPDDSRVAEARKEAKRIFDDARPDFESIILEHAEWRKRMTAWWLTNSRRRPVAILIRDPRIAKITTVIPASEVGGGSASIDAVVESGEGWKIMSVGSVNASGTNWNNMASIVPSGAILYISPTAVEKTGGPVN